LTPPDGRLVINAGRAMVCVSVTNLADRPIQVGSHYHFIETNPYLRFDRRKAYGRRLNILAGTAVRFEPGETKPVTLVDIAGNRVIRGGNNLCDGPVDPAKLEGIIASLVARGQTPLPANPLAALLSDRVWMWRRCAGFGHEDGQGSGGPPSPKRQRTGSSAEAGPAEVVVTREHFADIFGPSEGDVVRLGDTDLYIRGG
jgi:urease